MKYLIITYSYTPAVTPRAFRWSTIAEYWASNGNTVDVICAQTNRIAPFEVVNGVNVYRTTGGMEYIRGKLKNSNTVSKIEQPGTHKQSFNSNILSIVKQVHDHTWKKIYWPDYACLWFYPTLKKAKELVSANEYDGLITVSHPFTGHMLGLKLAKLGLKIPWIVDIGDPFYFLENTPVNNTKIYKKLNYKYEKSVLNSATFVTVTTHQTLVRYAELFSESADRLRVIPPLLTANGQQDDLPNVFTNNDKIRMAFVGTLYKNIRDPKFLLALFKKLLATEVGYKLELHFFGNYEECTEEFQPYDELLEKKIFIHGLVSHALANQAMREADIMVNIGNGTLYQLPSKLVEYAATGKRVLNLAKTINDSSAEFLKGYPLAFNIVEEQKALDVNSYRSLEEFIKNSPDNVHDQIYEWLLPYHVESIAGSYEKLINNLSK